MTHLGWALLSCGLFGLVATRLGWYDAGGLLRRIDWFNVYGFLDRSWLGGGVRRAMYAISVMLVLIGMTILARAA